MKKFLFTLAALFMAGSAFATNDYFAMDDLTLTQDQLGTEVAMPVTAHFEGMVSAFDLEFICPDGVTVTGHQFKPGRKIDCYMYSEDEDDIVMTSFTPSLKRQDNKIIAITSILEQEYDYVNGGSELTECGAVKWKPGDHYMLDIKLTFAADFKGGDIIVRTEPTCGQDPRTNWPRSTGEAYEYTVHITVKGDAPQPVVAPEPTFNWDENEYVMEATCEDHEVVLMIGDQVVNNPYAVIPTEVEQTITFTAYTVANDDEDENSATVEKTVTVPAKAKEASAKPQFAFDLGDEVATITVTGENISDITVAGTENYTIEGNVVTIPRPAYNENSVFVTVTATNTQTGWYTPTTATSDEYEVAPKAEKVYQTKTPVVTVTPSDDAYTLTATCEDEGQVVLVVQYIDEETGALRTERYNEGTVTIARTDKAQFINYWAEATANTPAGYDSVAPASSQVVTYYEIPAKKADEPVYDETCLNPNAAYNITGLELATVTITNREPGATVTYKVFKKNGDVWEEVTELAGEFTGDTYQFDVQGDGTYRVEMIAHLQGKNDSDLGALEFTIHEGETSSVNELANGKTVAGVRYFNMAGQEMQEANGMTIVVTTYTDGTTSAVKVMK
jgi:hypothetical protein